MSRQGKEYLSEVINAIQCTPDAFRIRLEDDRFLFSIMTTDTKTQDWFSVSAIYDSICEIDKRIKYAFGQAISYNLSETLEGFNSFSKLSSEEEAALYHVENIVLRVSILWDLLAQLCNVIYHTGISVDRIYYNRYFTKYSQGEEAIDIVKEIKTYIDQDEDLESDTTPWLGNHKFLNDYRNQLTHKISPSVSSISTLGFTLRPPTMYVLHRAVEDYYAVSAFLCRLVNEFLEDYKDWLPFE